MLLDGSGGLELCVERVHPVQSSNGALAREEDAASVYGYGE